MSMPDDAFYLISQAADLGGRIFVSNDPDKTADLVDDLLAKGLIVAVEGDMTGPARGQWYELTPAAWDMVWRRQRASVSTMMNDKPGLPRQFNAH